MHSISEIEKQTYHSKCTWSGTPLEYHPNPLYLGVQLDRTLSYRSHILSTKAKVNTRNNILRKLTNSKWGCTPHTLRASTLALCYTAAEYACPVWSRSVHASKLDPALNNACRTITGCLKPTNTSNLHLLACITPPEIRREIGSRAERLRHSTDPRHPLIGFEPALTRLKLRRSFLSHVQPEAEINMGRWIDNLKSNPPSVDIGIQPSESLPPGSNAPWPTWKTLNRLRSGVGHTKANLIKWGHHTGDPSCNCGTETQTMEHLLQCPLLKTPCSCDDLSIFYDTAKKCVELWQSTI